MSDDNAQLIGTLLAVIADGVERIGIATHQHQDAEMSRLGLALVDAHAALQGYADGLSGRAVDDDAFLRHLEAEEIAMRVELSRQEREHERLMSKYRAAGEDWIPCMGIIDQLADEDADS